MKHMSLASTHGKRRDVGDAHALKQDPRSQQFPDPLSQKSCDLLQYTDTLNCGAKI